MFKNTLISDVFYFFCTGS